MTGGFLWADGDPEQKSKFSRAAGEDGGAPLLMGRSDRTGRREALSHMRDETMQEGAGKGATDHSLPPHCCKDGAVWEIAHRTRNSQNWEGAQQHVD